MSHDVGRRVREAVRDVPDFPSAGILFKDITPVLAQPALMRDAVTAMAQPFADAGITHVVGIESRGFLFGVPIALTMNTPFVPVRKPGKLPFLTVRESYALEYRSDILEMHSDSLGPGARALVIDDVLATGGTAAAASRLIEQLGGTVVGISVLIELAFLGGRAAVAPKPTHAVLVY
jgi:adenine phosphoribosyltransferase